jgi:outer membrane protein assembly factor BamB
MDRRDNNGATDFSARLTTLRHYMRALEYGDLDAVAAVVRQAETDAALEQMVLATNETYLDQRGLSRSVSNTRAWPVSTAPRPVEFTQERQPDSRAYWPGPRWLGALAAVLLITALVGGFFVLFSRHSFLGSSPTPTSQPTRVCSAAPTATGVPSARDSATMVVGSQQEGRIIALASGDGAIVWQWPSGYPDMIVRSADIVYVASHPTNAGSDACVTALRASDGAVLWKVTTLTLPLFGYTHLALDGNTLLVDALNGDGSVYALDALTGKLRWSQSINNGLTGRLITATGGTAYITNLTGFDAYDVQTGKLRWSYSTGTGPADTTGNSGPSVVMGSDDLVYYYLYDPVSGYPPETTRVAALDASTGAVRRHLTLAQIGIPLFVAPNGIVYSTKDERLCATRIADARRLWCNASMAIDPLDSSLRLIPTSAGLLYSRIVNGQVDGRSNPVSTGLLDGATGKTLWSWQGPATLYSAANSMSLTGDAHTMYLTTRKGLYAFDVATGRLMWHTLGTTDLSFVQSTLAG